MNFFYRILILTNFFVVFSCKETSKKEIGNQPINLTYAKGFQLSKVGKIKKLIIYPSAKEKENGQEYWLVPHLEKVPNHSNKIQIIRVPVKRIVVTSSSHIPFLEALNEEKSLVGFPGTDFISSKKTRKRIQQNKVKELGKNENVNTENLLVTAPDLVMSFTVGKPNKSFDVVKKMGIPVLYNGDWLEKTPLARVEWIRLFGALYCKEKQADEIFKSIEKEYNSAKQLALKAKIKPTVLSGAMFQDVWYLPAGESFMAQFFKDAQTNYIWKNSVGTGSLSLNIESVLEKAKFADFWIGTSNFASKNELLNASEHYQQIKAFQQNKAYTFANFKGETGGFFYFELGPLQPHILLKDIVKIAHPELLPNYKPQFFQKLD